MPLIAPLLLLMFIGQLMFSIVTTNDANITLNDKEIEAVGQNMLVYSTYARRYANANPALVGAVNSAAIGFPTWYVPPAQVANYMSGGKAYVYYTGQLKGLPYYLVSSTQDGFRAGINVNGVLASPTVPSTATTGLVIPAAVPNGAVVLMP